MKKLGWVIGSILFFAVAGFIAFRMMDYNYGYTPQSDKLVSYNPNNRSSYDLWGEHITDKQAAELLKTEEGRKKLSAKNGAVKIDKELLELGRKTFYEETFGNEVFLTDIMGIIDGPFTIGKVTKAIASLKGKGTSNLQVELANDIKIGNKSYKKGEKIDTGIDVVKGTYVPMGMPVSVSDGRVRVGISCAACHATVDPISKKVVEGAPNNDFNLGLLLALATNSSAYFTHANTQNLKQFIMDMDRTITNSEGKVERLPHPEKLEKAVDDIFAKWPRGNFDSTIDLVSNPAQIPDSFTLKDHPYGWSGFAAAGPFKGLAAFSNNVHAQNADSLSQSELSKDLFGVDKEVYLGTILQNAANPKFRYEPALKEKPSEFFRDVDPTPDAVGINQIVEPPQFPKISFVAPDGVIVSSPKHKFNEQNNGVAAWQNTIQPPKPNGEFDQNTVSAGRKVFERANCMSCHAGDALTNNKVISVNKIGTEATRAKSFKKTEKIFGESALYSPDTPIPLPKNPTILKVPTDKLDPEQIMLAFARGNSPGGYKVPSLIGLYWTAPYLHDGGVSVGPDLEKEIGVPGTLLSGKLPNPANSLKALVDGELRKKVVETNKSSKDLQQVHVTGEGHEFWVDETTGFTEQEQNVLIKYLLSLSSINDKGE
ncbi:electron transport protein [Neobacillus muris]|uniref:electron transport protein n=1 Tax=Neobacillus muris TaxID=2941334 RepID=UPI002041F930|nr:electron transport protein [Neobacillus muris]